jgi:hypothetical protein
MPVTLEPFAGDSLHGLDRPKFGLAWSPEMNRLHRHGSIMHPGTLIDKPTLTPTAHMFPGSKAPWHEILDDLPGTTSAVVMIDI